jgi:hypothetical protein
VREWLNSVDEEGAFGDAMMVLEMKVGKRTERV